MKILNENSFYKINAIILIILIYSQQKNSSKFVNETFQ